MRIIEVSPEAVDLIEINILDDFSEVKILVLEASILNTHTKVNIQVTIIKVITTKASVVYTTIHVEAINKVTIMANLEAEAVAMAEVITMKAAMVGLIIEAITTIKKLYHQWEFIHKVNTNTEMSLVILTYNTMTSVMVMHSLSKTSAQHYYNKNYKTRTGAYMTPSQPKVIKYPQKWMLRQCHMQCIFQVVLRQLLKLIISHTRQ